MVQKFIDNKGGIPSCDQNTVITDFETGEIYCGNCGIVLSERMEDLSPEWRVFGDNNENKVRIGTATSLAKHDQGLNTIINSINKDASGKSLSPKMRRNLNQLRMLDRQSQTRASIDRNFIKAFTKLNGLKHKLVLSNEIIEEAAYIYRKAVERRLVRGRSISAMIAASLYAACRNSKTPRTLKDVAEASNIEKKEIAFCYRLIFNELELKMPVVNSIQCIARISSRLEITEKTKRQAIKILRQAQEIEFSAGKDPMGLAAAALYLSCMKNGEERTQQEFENAANITKVTIRNRSKDLALVLKIE